MESSVSALTEARRTVIERVAAIPCYCCAVIFGTTSIVIGVLWDISWHATIAGTLLEHLRTWQSPWEVSFLVLCAAGSC